MDISAIFYAALGGGGGAALGSVIALLFQKPRGKLPEDGVPEGKKSAGLRSGLSAGFAVAGFTILGGLYKNMTLPRIVPLDDSEIIQDLPIMAVIKEESPESYKEILIPVDRAVRNGDIKQADLDEMRSVYFKLIKAKTETATGATLRMVEKSAQDQSRVFREKAPRICTLIINGESFPAVDEYLSEAEAKAEQSAMVKLFTQEPRDPDFAPNLERGKVVFEESLLATMRDLGITDLRPDVSETAGNEDEHRKICDFAIAFSENKQGLSDHDILNLTAYLKSLQ